MPARRSGIASGALAISLLMPACQGAEPAPSSTAEPTSAPSNAPATPATTARSAAGSLVVTLDGKPLALPHAAAVKGNASSIWLQLSDQPLECSDLRPHDLQNLGKRLQLLLSPKLQADGSKVWKVAASRMRGLPMRFATAKGEQKVAVRGSVDGTVEVELKATLLERPHGPVELRGKDCAKLVAEGRFSLTDTEEAALTQLLASDLQRLHDDYGVDTAKAWGISPNP